MCISLKTQAKNYLYSLADYRVLFVRQAVVLDSTNPRSLRRRMQKLVEQKLVNKIELNLSGKSGRPELIYRLTPEGAEYLKEIRVIDPQIPTEKILWKSKNNLKHQLSLNWAIISAKILERYSILKVRGFSHSSPFHFHCENNVPFLYDTVSAPNGNSQRIGFIPDAVITITHPELNKTLLFFLEIDRSTEPLDGEGYPQKAIRRKILNYQAYMNQGGYQRYEKTFEATFHGFRLLIVSDSFQRHTKLCQLVRETPPTDFIWLTTEPAILDQGFGAPIWAKGGDDSVSPQSILSSKYALVTGIHSLYSLS